MNATSLPRGMLGYEADKDCTGYCCLLVVKEMYMCAEQLNIISETEYNFLMFPERAGS